MQFCASREFEEWKVCFLTSTKSFMKFIMILHLRIYMVSQGKRLAAQERKRLNDAPHLLSRGGYAKLEKKIRKSRAEALGLESPDLAPAPARYELWKAARTKSDGNMTSSTAALISQRIDELVEQQTQGTFVGQCREDILTTAIGKLEHPGRFTRPQKQPMHESVIDEDDEMAEAEDDPLSKLMIRLPRLNISILVPLYITFNDALEIIGGDRMLNISILQLWCMYMDTIVIDQGRSSMYEFVEPQTIQASGQIVQVLYPKVCNKQLDSWECGFYVMSWIKTIIRAVITDDWNECLKSTSPIPEDTIRQIRQEWTTYLLQR
ncbi:hypothetical protein LR48_Vigan08g076000 [Vigna angularis]|uniref:Ubiquitin-like protease family profile domain-containing protein n=1 Tax=Phaseolus angularis TaxID=3914 RepID=A0A0L9V4K5_PHAAN|nr:hypothetical protein LR48_Vigan08g076000 [Vigna angularis]